eukprot:m.155077 g.155077  ORF g.155077 m.155077 type:complete len:258 (+) comp16405_c0_seq4:106-879(+)
MLTVQLLLMVVCSKVALSDMPPHNDSSIMVDSQGRVILSGNDVMIANNSMRELYSIVMALYTAHRDQVASSQALITMVQALNASLVLERAANKRLLEKLERFNPRSARLSKLVANDSAQVVRFGRAIAIAGNTVLAAAFNNAARNESAVYVFEKDGTGGYGQTGKLVARDGRADTDFGRAISATDSLVVVGAWLDNDGTNNGAVYVFERSSAGGYLQVSRLVSDGSEFFGWAVAATNRLVVVGAPSPDYNRSVVVFE